MHVMIIAKCHFCKICSKKAILGKTLLRKTSHLAVIIVRTVAIASTHFVEDKLYVCVEDYLEPIEEI